MQDMHEHREGPPMHATIMEMSILFKTSVAND